MKKLTVKFIGYMMVMTLPLIMFTSCEKDPCEDVTCTNGAIATEDGDECPCVGGTTLIAGKTYEVVETCDTTGGATYDVVITQSSADETKVIIAGFGGYSSISADAVVNGLDITVTSQSSGGFTVSGSGTISNDGATITFSYEITDSGNNTEGCDGTWTVQ